MRRCAMIAASAGSGKTFALVSRLIQLLAGQILSGRDAAPERIVALTFSRAAAGEIFDSLMTRLARAAATPDAAEKEAREHLHEPRLRQQHFLAILRAVLSTMHLSPIGTLDSFFVRILRAFPFEFGTAGTFEILDEHQLTLAKDTLLRGLLRDSSGNASDRKAFLAAFKLATFGNESKTVQAQISDFIDRAHGLYLEVPQQELWGNEDAIWPDGCVWLRDAPANVAAESEALLRLLTATGVDSAQIEKWQELIELADAFTAHPGALLPAASSHLFWKLLDVFNDLAAGSADITVNRRRVCLDAATCRHAGLLVRHILARHLLQRLRNTEGMFSILERYECAYAATLRRTGRLTFGDITFLLARGDDPANAPQLSGIPELAGNRLYIDYRLDGAYDHWALDEFQDTSRQQWRVISNLIDEVVQDTSGTRTFFAVGDVKQAIYGWRGGDAGLMSEILKRYGCDAAGPLALETLARSWRSSATVLDAVNAVFGHVARAEGLPAEVVKRWHSREVWEFHEPAKAMPGYAALLEIPYEKGLAADEYRDRKWAAAVEVLRQIKPWDRGRTAAALVRKRKTGTAFAECLRRAGIPAVWEGDTCIADNPVVAAFLALLTLAEHPGDTLAYEHVMMTPLRRCMPGTESSSRNDVARELLRDVHDSGFEVTIRKRLAVLEAGSPLREFSRKRVDELLAAAQVFDATGGKSCLDFVTFAKSYAVRDLPAENTVRVMTVHRSKGLGFDLVLLPDLDGDSLTSVGSLGTSVCRPEDRGKTTGGAWILSMPAGDVARCDPVLDEHLTRVRNERCFEELCLLYVAMTRAKQGLYMVTRAATPRSAVVNWAAVLRACLSRGEDAPVVGPIGPAAVLYENGDPAWFETPRATDASESCTLAPERVIPTVLKEERHRFLRRLPSEQEAAPTNAGRLFSVAARRGRELGTAVHTLFQEVTWLDTEPSATVIERWRRRHAVDAALARETECIFRKAVAAEEVRALLRRPSDSTVELWREKNFEMILGGDWVSGTFDRVVLRKDGVRGNLSATLIDFKSDRVGSGEEIASAVERYRSQLALYRRVLACLTELPERCIEAVLLFTHPARAIAVENPASAQGA